MFELDELKKELKERPEKYTEDLKILVPKYEKQMKKLIALLKKNNK